MAKIHTLKISNFKGIKTFEQTFHHKDFICIIGRGDSCKTTILEAISLVLSPNWNIGFHDTDFYNCDTSQPICIEATLYDIPDELLKENKYGKFKRFLDNNDEIIDDILDNNLNEDSDLLTIKLEVYKDLEPKWYIFNSRLNDEKIEISAKDRSKLNVFFISENTDKHFSWSKGNPLYSILQQEKSDNSDKNIVINAFREAKINIDNNSFSYLNNIVNKINTNAKDFGVHIEEISTKIDFKDLLIKDNKLCLHDDKIPLRLKGKGSKRLISIVIQHQLVKFGGILLIDEIEQSLEPDRVQHLVNVIKKNNQNKGQIFITTHSRDVLVEIGAKDLFLMKKDSNNLIDFNEYKKEENIFDGCIRSNPEAFFAKKILICEGVTEIGIARALNDYRISNKLNNISLLGIRYVDGRGDNLIEYAEKFLTCFNVGIFCDSDTKPLNDKKPFLIDKGAKIFDCLENNSIEDQIFVDLPFEAIKELINYAIKEKEENSISDQLNDYYHKSYQKNLPSEWINNDSSELRLALGSISKKNKWFKRTDHGTFIGSVCCKYLLEMSEDKHLKIQINKIINWIDNV